MAEDISTLYTTEYVERVERMWPKYGIHSQLIASWSWDDKNNDDKY